MKKCSHRIDEIPERSKGRKAHIFLFSSRFCYSGCYQKVLPKCMMGVSHQNTLIKEISHGSPDPVRLTTRIRYHREKIFILDCSFKKRFHDCGEGVATEHEAAGHPVFTLQVSDRGEVSATNET